MTKINKRKHSAPLVDGPEQAPSRSMLRAAGFEDDDFISRCLSKTMNSQIISQESILTQWGDSRYGFHIEFEVEELSNNKRKLHIRLNENFSIGLVDYPPGYFSGLTLSEREKILQEVSGIESVGFLLTWPKHVFVDSKGLDNDCEY